jgi:hypothetical protein
VLLRRLLGFAAGPLHALETRLAATQILLAAAKLGSLALEIAGPPLEGSLTFLELALTLVRLVAHGEGLFFGRENDLARLVVGVVTGVREQPPRGIPGLPERSPRDEHPNGDRRQPEQNARGQGNHEFD